VPPPRSSAWRTPAGTTANRHKPFLARKAQAELAVRSAPRGVRITFVICRTHAGVYATIISDVRERRRHVAPLKRVAGRLKHARPMSVTTIYCCAAPGAPRLIGHADRAFSRDAKLTSLRLRIRYATDPGHGDRGTLQDLISAPTEYLTIFRALISHELQKGGISPESKQTIVSETEGRYPDCSPVAGAPKKIETNRQIARAKC
jgi:hypothetical protein